MDDSKLPYEETINNLWWIVTVVRTLQLGLMVWESLPLSSSLPHPKLFKAMTVDCMEMCDKKQPANS